DLGKPAGVRPLAVPLRHQLRAQARMPGAAAAGAPAHAGVPALLPGRGRIAGGGRLDEAGVHAVGDRVRRRPGTDPVACAPRARIGPYRARSARYTTRPFFRAWNP